MTHRLAAAGALLSTAALAIVLAASAAAQQQQPANSRLASPPNADIGARIRGAPQPPMPAADDKLPVNELKLPQGFHIETYISGVMDARSLRLGDKGTVFVSNRNRDKVYAVVTRGGKRQALTIASGLDRPNGLAF